PFFFSVLSLTVRSLRASTFVQIHDWILWRRHVDAFSLGEAAAAGDARSSSSQDALSEATCLELVREGKMLRTARVVYVETRLLTQAEKMHLVPPLATDEEKAAQEKKEEKEKEKKEDKEKEKKEKQRDEGGGDDGRVMLDDECEEAVLAGAERSQRRATETAGVALGPPWLRRNLRYNRTFICTLRGNHANSRTASEDDVTVFPDDTLLRAIPLDKRISWILIPLREAQKWVSLPGLLDKQRLYLVNVDVWDAFNVLPRGSILTYIGPAGSVQTIERCCMLQNDLQAHTLPHSQEVLAESDEIVRLAEESFETEARRRVDLRGVRRVFTIDPASARDLDDAVHVHRLPASAWTGRDPEIEIGVHIADVSHFLSPLCKTDEEARERCTTVYLTHVVFPMLPRALCDSLCSLHLGSPKLTFSVNFRVHEDGSLVKAWPPRFYKSVMESCCRFNYEQVQVLIDGGDLPPDSRPALASPWSSASVTLGTCGCFVALSAASASSSASGVFSGSVVPASCAREMARPSFPFAPRAKVETVQSCCGSCASCCVCGRGESQGLEGVAWRSDRSETRGERTNEEARENRGAPGKLEVAWTAVVDDLRLLDALTVEIRKKRFANGSLLLHKATLRFALDARSRPTDWHLEEHSRSHTLIEELMLLANCLVAERLIASPFSDLAVLRLHPPLLDKQRKSLTAFLSKLGLSTDFSSSKETQRTLENVRTTRGDCAAVAVEALLRKALKLALYYVHGDALQPHFALHFDEYTHFTSPIRRYADVLVHRLLACSLEWEWQNETQPSIHVSSPSSPSSFPSSLPPSSPSSSPSFPSRSSPLRQDERQESAALLAFRRRVEAMCGDKDQLEALCGQCNAKKMNAKQAQTDCDRFFLAIHLKQRRTPEATVGVVLMLQDRSLVVFLPLLDKEQRITFQTEEARGQALRSVDPAIQKGVDLPVLFRKTSATELEVHWENRASGERQTQTLQTFSAAPVYVLPTDTVPADFLLTLISPFSPDYASVKAREKQAFAFFLNQAEATPDAAEEPLLAHAGQK
ncbi:UNVERIFIED_CONTAM: RNB family domain-containing protein, partial [Hammondia hammondi]